MKNKVQSSSSFEFRSVRILINIREKISKMWFIYILFFWKFLILSTWVLAFKRSLLRVAFTFLKTQSRKMLKWVKEIETNEASENSNIDPYCCAIKAVISGKLETVGHIPRKVSRHVFFFIGEEGGHFDGCQQATVPRPSPVMDSEYRWCWLLKV